MRGEFDKVKFGVFDCIFFCIHIFEHIFIPQNVLDGKEAQCLANQFQMYYGQDFPSKISLLKDFTKKPDHFKHMDLIAELENIKIE